MPDDMAAHGASYRVPHHGGMDPATRRLAVIAGVLGAALFAVIGAWSMFGAPSGTVPVIAPPPGPVRVKPANPGGLKITNPLAAFTADTSDPADAKLAPAPQTPDPSALLPKPPAAPVQAAAAPAVAPAAVPTAAPVATPGSASRPAPPSSLAASQSSHAQAAVPGGVQVQLAALETRARAEAEWHLLARKAGTLLDGRAPSYSRAVVNGRTWWRIRLGGFTDAAAARVFCGRMHATGAACSVARF